jgi:hypothetical protein
MGQTFHFGSKDMNIINIGKTADGINLTPRLFLRQINLRDYLSDKLN